MQKLSTHRASRKTVARLPLYRARVGAFMDSLPVTVLSIAITLVILFLDDFRTCLAPKSADPVFYHLTLAIFVLFAVELAVCSVTKDNYFMQFFFWLDLLAAFSLVPDIPYMWDPILGVDSTADPSNPLSLSAAVQASSRASPANRAIKFVRLIRLVRIAKLFELCAKTRGGALTMAHGGGGGAGAVAGMRKGHSAVGQHLSEQTTRKVVLLVLLMLFGIPLLQPTPSQQAEEYSLRELSMLSASPTLTSAEWSNEVNFTLSYYPSILYLNVSPPAQPPSSPSATTYTLEYIDPSLSQYRVSELLSVSYNNVLALFSQREQSRLTGEYNIVTTLVVLVLLAVGAVLFNRNNHRMVIVPIERMMATIVALQQNPLAKASLASAQAGGIATATSDKPNGGGGTGSVGGSGTVSKKNSQLNLNADDGGHSSTGGFSTTQLAHNTQQLTSAPHNRHGSTVPATASTSSDTHNETGMLERTLEKLTGLLQVGFGEAGSKMIQKCMQLNAEGDLDPLVDGTKMHAIFGFCDIRRFTDATECLKEDVMMYVNEIAAIVHSQVAACDGNPNKNIGDAFLLVWRLPQELETEDIVELQRMISKQGVGSGADSTRSSPSHTVTSHPNDWVTPKAGGVRSRAATSVVEEGRERAESATESVASTGDRPSDAVKPQSLIHSTTHRQQNKPSILRHLTGNGFPFSPAGPGAQSPSRGAFDLKEALSMLPARHLTPQLRASVSTLADKALVSFIRVIVEINASDELKRYKLNPRIKAAFDDFQVELGFGLHVGWAIEGPIGSRYKIDASYLSPHVNLAETLEGTTKVYGVPLLLSGEMYALLSPFVRAFCRRLDCVKVSGREMPITLYTFDMQQKGMDAVCRGEQLQAGIASSALGALDEVKEERRERDDSFVTITATSAHSAAPKLSLSTVSSTGAMPSSSPTLSAPSNYASSLRSQFTISSPQPLAPHHYVRSSLLPVLQQHIPLDFFDWHAAGVESYISGQWSLARRYLERAQDIMLSASDNGDEPTRVVLAYMKEANYVAPDTWAGFRAV